MTKTMRRCHCGRFLRRKQDEPVKTELHAVVLFFCEPVTEN